MIKKLTSIGNSLGLVIERPILELLDIDSETDLDIKTDGESLIIRPVRKDHETRVKESVELMMEIHDNSLKKLPK